MRDGVVTQPVAAYHDVLAIGGALFNRNQDGGCLHILDFRDEACAHLMLFSNVSHYEGVPERVLTRHLSKWWDPPAGAA